MNPQNVMALLIAVAAVAVSVFSALPYPWARPAAAAIGAAIAGVHGSSFTFGTLTKPTGNGNNPPA